MRALGLLLGGAVAAVAGGCERPARGERRSAVAALPAAAAPAAPIQVRFSDVTREAGIDFEHYTGAHGKKYYPETMGSGCAFFDVDVDGWVDLLLLNGCDWPDAPRRRRATMRLYRNDRKGGFRDVTGGSGLDVEMYAIGCAAGDYDSDGDADLYATAGLGPSRLFRNEGGGRFRDVTRAAGVDNKSEFAASAVWFDYDRDGRLDLFICNYIRWTPATDIRCEVRKSVKEYCTPESYSGIPCRLYRNRGDGRFEDVSERAGIRSAVGKSMSAAVCDYDADGWPDLVVTNDTQPTFLFRNNGKGAFTEMGIEAGIALGESGKAKAGMGVDAVDVANNGTVAILTSNFSGESLSYFVSQPGGTFLDTTSLAGFGHTSLLYVGWGLFFFDYDLDGWSDAFVANGHIYPNVKSYQPTISFAERPLLYRNRADGTFAEIGAGAGSGMAPMVARGAAYADYDHDGDLDIALNANRGSARLVRNDCNSGHGWLCLQLQGSESNREAVGAVVRVTTGSTTQTQMVRGGSSYASQSDLRLTFGLGQAGAAERIEVRWPAGRTALLKDVRRNQRLRIREGAEAAPEPLP